MLWSGKEAWDFLACDPQVGYGSEIVFSVFDPSLFLTGIIADSPGQARGWYAQPPSTNRSEWLYFRSRLCLTNIQISHHVVKFYNAVWMVIWTTSKNQQIFVEFRSGDILSFSRLGYAGDLVICKYFQECRVKSDLPDCVHRFIRLNGWSVGGTMVAHVRFLHPRDWGTIPTPYSCPVKDTLCHVWK